MVGNKFHREPKDSLFSSETKMASGTLYTYPGSQRAQKVIIAAAYSGVDVKVDPDFEFGKTNTTSEFLKKFPLGKVPAFEDADGHCLNESNAIAQYVSNEALCGGADAINQALVREYMDFAENEILPSACTWTYPTLGFKQYNKQDTDKAMTHIKKCLNLLNDLLLSRTFLVGERITLADIALCCNLLILYVQVLDPNFRKPYENVNRWFITCINQPNFTKVLGEVTLCAKMATFDNKRYQELHPKEQKKGKDQAKKQAKPKQEKPEKEKPAEEEPPKPKKIDYFADVPKSAFVMDDWKKMYSNNEYDVVVDYLWKNFDHNAYSFWTCEYKYNEELKMDFLAMNLIGGYFQRMEGLRKHAFGIMLLHSEDNRFTIKGLWMLRGLKLAFNLNPDWNYDAEHYNFVKLDPSNKEEDKNIINKYMAWDGTDPEDGNVFK